MATHSFWTWTQILPPANGQNHLRPVEHPGLESEQLHLLPGCWGSRRSKPLPEDSPAQLDVFGHDGDPVGVDGAQVGDQVNLAGLLQSHEGGALEAQVGPEVLSNLPHQAAR